MIAQANSFRLPLHDDSIHCSITSIPYWGLRDYGLKPLVFGGRADCRHEWGEAIRSEWANSIPGPNGRNKNPLASNRDRSKESGQFCRHCSAWLGSYGLEPHISLFVSHTVEVCREVKRVLRPDGVFWLNIGDSYATGKNGRSAADGKALGNDDRTFRDKPFSITEVPAKNLCLIPQRVVIALQEDGWIVRSAPPWVKRNPMPESVGDRPGTGHEYIYMLVKSGRYWWDGEAVRRENAQIDYRTKKGLSRIKYNGKSGDKSRNDLDADWKGQNPAGRALRTSDFFFDSLDAAIAHLTAIRDSGGLLLDDGGGPGAFVVNPKGYSGAGKNDKELGRYAHSYDRIDKVSPDCPIHSHLLGSQKFDILGCDEQPNQIQNHIGGNDENHGQVSFFEPTASPQVFEAAASFDFVQSLPRPTSQPQTLENIDDCKSEVDPHGHTSGAQIQTRTNRTSTHDDAQDCKMDSGLSEYSQIATVHNTQTHKMARVPLTSSQDNASAEIVSRIGDTSKLLLQTDLVDRISENNIEGDSVSNDQGVGLSEQRAYRNEGNKILSSGNCTCKLKKVNSDHYATFPLALVEPMIKASAPDRCCPKCGRGWVRVTEPTPEYAEHLGKDWADYGQDATEGRGHAVSGQRPTKRNGASLTASYQTTGWRPGCDCNSGEPIPAVILDPFCGSGTVGQAARELGRRFIGLDLSPKYLQENALPRAEKLTSAAALATLPLFGGELEAA